MSAAGASVRENCEKGSAGCERDEIRQQRKFPAPDHRDHQRREHQTDRVIDQQRRENSRCERQIEQEPPRSAREPQDKIRGPFEKVREI